MGNEAGKFIKANQELKEEIAKKFEVTTRTVENALSYKTNSLAARLYRSYALNHGGKLYQEVSNPYNEIVQL